MAALIPDAKQESNCSKDELEIESMMVLRHWQGNLRLVFRLYKSHPRQSLG